MNVGKLEAQAVGQKAPNPWGLHDVHGNAREFIQDGIRNYDGRPQTDPIGTNGAPSLKGGGFSDLNRDLRSASRGNLGGDFATSAFGFRLYMRFDGPVPEEPLSPEGLSDTGADSLTISTVAGGGIGDGGRATDASISPSSFIGMAKETCNPGIWTSPLPHALSNPSRRRVSHLSVSPNTL